MSSDKIEVGRDEIEMGRDEIEMGRDEIEMGRDEIEVDRDEKLKHEIQWIFNEYIKLQTYTNTPGEKQAEGFLSSWFKKQDYFSEHPEHWGLYKVENDPLDRCVVWGMVRGKGDDTIVLIHHYDVVETRDYELAQPFAHDVQRINDEILVMRHKFDPESLRDLLSGKWQFGRGSADMKAGGAIQLALLKQYAKDPGFKGNVILLGLPDEENLSAGMRSAITLLSDLKRKYLLRFKLMINSEPHQSVSDTSGMVYEGSVGKLMPVVYIRGSLAHVGRIFEGLNPLHLISELIINTELNPEFSDTASGEATPPPSWLYLKDGKTHYDVSIPTEIRAYLSVLTMGTQPGEFLEKFKLTARESFSTVIHRMNRSYKTYLKATAREVKSLPWRVNVKTFAELFREVSDARGDTFQKAYQNKREEINGAVADGTRSLVDSSFDLIEFCLGYSRDKSPVMVIGFSPPYYPDVTNQAITGLDSEIRSLGRTIHQFSMDQWQKPYLTKRYYTGISDLSYGALCNTVDQTSSIRANMPLWGKTYHIPFDDIRLINMPCMNIGPWGKDFHKITERVYIEDLYERTPKILDFVITHLLKEKEGI